MEPNNIKNLKFSIDAILNKHNDKKLVHQVLDQKKQVAPQAKIQNVMQELQLPTPRVSNEEQQESKINVKCSAIKF